MKRAVFFLLAALFILMVVQPNISAGTTEPVVKTPVYSEDAALRTNNDVERDVSSSNALIMIDPGRGGKDTGYTGGTLPEKDITMLVALNIGSALEQDGYQVAYTRWYDDVPACATTQECDQLRVQKAKEAGADYLLSIRFNQDDSMHRGYSIFTQPDNAALEALGKEMALQIQNTSYSLYEGLDTDHYASFPVLSDPDMPTILLQLGYLTNPQDYARISESKFQTKIANAIAQAFLNTIH